MSERFRKAHQEAWKREEQRQWVFGTMGKKQDDGDYLFNVPGRSGFVFVTIRVANSGAQTAVPARNDAGVPHSPKTSIRMKLEYGNYVIYGRAGDQNTGTINTPVPPSGVPPHNHTEGSEQTFLEGTDKYPLTDAGEAKYALWSTILDTIEDTIGDDLTDTLTIGWTYDLDGNTIEAEVNDGSITYAKIQDIPTDSLIGRDAAGTGSATAIGLGASLSMDGSNNLQRAALTGDVTAPVNSNATTIENDAVTDAKLRNSGALTVIGRAANTSGDPADIAAVAASGAVLRESGSTIGFGTVATAGISADAITFAKIQNIATDSLIGRDTAGTGDPENILLGASLSMDGSGNLQRAALTGDVTASVNSNATTIANNAVTTAKILDANVTLAKLANIATDSLIGRDTAASGVPEVITLGASLSMDGSLHLQRAALTGDVTAPANSNATTIANDAVTTVKILNANVTLAKMADLAQATIIGRAAAAGTGVPTALSAAQVATIVQASIDHGSIAGLADDDHTQYALLAGRAGGQTLVGGTAASENLTLSSTAHATKGKILFGAAGNSAYDGVNDRLGIGTNAPAGKIEVQTNENVGHRIFIRNTNAGTAAQAYFNAQNDGSISFQAGALSSGFTASGMLLPNDVFFQANPSRLIIRTLGAFDMLFGTNGIERMRILDTGQIGIGNADPIGELEVLSTSTSNANRGITSTQINTGAQAAVMEMMKARGTRASKTTVANADFVGVFYFNAYDGTNYLATAGFAAKVNGTVAAGSIPTDLIFFTGAVTNPSITTESMRIKSTGEVGIGLTNPAYLLDVDGPIHSSGQVISDGIIVNSGGIKVQTADVTKNANVTFADLTGLSVTLLAGKTYIIRAVLYVTVDVNAGAKFQFAGTSTLTSGIASIWGMSNTNNNVVFAIKSTPKTLGGQQIAGGGTDWTVFVDATIVVNAAGTLTLQFAQQVSFAGNCTVKAQSMMEVRQLA